jgi:cytochrome c oxidase cbb3-type subunit 2
VARWARPRPRDFRQGVFKFRTTPYGSLPTTADLDRVIQDGLYGTLMPPFNALNPRARLDVIAYLQTLSPRWRTEQPGTPVVVPDEPTPTTESVTRGRELFGANCSSCHGDGTGNGPAAGGMTDVWGASLQPANLAVGRTKSARTTRDIYIRIMTGINVTPMPGFAAALKPDQAWQIAHYVEALGAWPGSSRELRELVAGLPPAASAPAASATADTMKVVAAAPGEGTSATIVVKMLGDAKGYRFEPAAIRARVGDIVRFVNVSGGPHNVSFWADSIPPGAAGQLQRNMGTTMSPLIGEMISQANAEYQVSIASLPPGAYQYYCLPHLALGMRGQIVVER